MKKRLFYLFNLLLAISLTAQQQDSTNVENLTEIILTATKIPTEKKNVGKIVYKITQDIIEVSQGKSVVDLLNDIPGIEINGNYGTKGQNLGYYVRGGRNRQVAILIDGINVSDPSSFNGDFDLRQIPLDQIESIEVMKGAASTLYGTGAATGVINIILKKANKKEFSGSFSSFLGTNNSQEDLDFNLNEIETSINFNGTIKNVDYLISFNGLQSKGLSAAESSDANVAFQEDPFNRLNTLLKVGYSIKDNFRIGLFGSYDEFTANYDEFDFMSNGYIDADNSIKSIQKRVGLSPSFKYKKGEIKLNTFYTRIDRNIHPASDRFQGEAYGFDIYNNYKVSKSFSVLAGLTAQYQDMYQKTAFSSIEEGSAKQHFYDPYISLNYNSNKGFNINAGTRLNIHHEYGNHFVYNFNPSYNFDVSKGSKLKIFASYSTAFITPTLQELFMKLSTIDELKPEQDMTVEGGFDWSFSKKLAFNVVYFYREETDKIGYDFTTFQTINDEGTFVANGVESEVVFSPLTNLKATVNYGYIHRDKSLLLKIPQHKIGINLLYHISTNSKLSFNGKFVDATTDFGDVPLPSYRLVDVFLNHTLIENRLTIFASGMNIFNEDYQEIAGFSTRGRNFKLGLKLKF